MEVSLLQREQFRCPQKNKIGQRQAYTFHPSPHSQDGTLSCILVGIPHGNGLLSLLSILLYVRPLDSVFHRPDQGLPKHVYTPMIARGKA